MKACIYEWMKAPHIKTNVPHIYKDEIIRHILIKTPQINKIHHTWQLQRSIFILSFIVYVSIKLETGMSKENSYLKILEG
jgi:hypothetical protein